MSDENSIECSVNSSKFICEKKNENISGEQISISIHNIPRISLLDTYFALKLIVKKDCDFLIHQSREENTKNIF